MLSVQAPTLIALKTASSLRTGSEGREELAGRGRRETYLPVPSPWQARLATGHVDCDDSMVSGAKELVRDLLPGVGNADVRVWDGLFDLSLNLSVAEGKTRVWSLCIAQTGR